MRRIVTGRDAEGRSVFVSDGPIPRAAWFRSVPGFVAELAWTTEPGAVIPCTPGDPTIGSTWLPAAGGTNAMFVTFPPASVTAGPAYDAAAVAAEYAQELPGLAEHFERSHPGMHTTPTIDYGLLLEGELHLELDDGQSRRLDVHDMVVQNGTRHAWRNRSDRPATMLFVLVGARPRV